MATSNAISKNLLAAIKKAKATTAPWKFLKPQIGFEEDVHKHNFRKNSMPVTVRLYPTIMRAVEMFIASNHFTAFPYLMISKKNAGAKEKEYWLELDTPGITFLYHKTGAEIRMSSIEPDGMNNPVSEFEVMAEEALASLILLTIPKILEEDVEEGGKINEWFATLTRHTGEFSSWFSDADIPDEVSEAAYAASDAIFCYMKDVAKWSFADEVTATLPEQVEETEYSSIIKGAVVVCSDESVNFRFLASNGKADTGSRKTMNVGEAKKEFGSFMAHRNWTQQEKMLIPYFPDDMPVMDEVISFLRIVTSTRDWHNPFRNLLWRGPTGYGKSTGVKQMACILNIPLMIITCHPNMELTEFMSTFVPESESDGLDMADVTTVSGEEPELPPLVQAAVDHLKSMTEEERNDFMGKNFFMKAMMDTDFAAFCLFGEETAVDTEELCQIYTEAACYFNERPLRGKIQALKNEVAKEKTETKQKSDNKPGFKHVMSSYIKALINGYMVEIQELSRIRDSGVVVGLNEYDKAGATIRLMNGALARRHKDALTICTDNVGYVSCRPIDPSSIRRFDFAIDSDKLTEQQLKDRTRRNTGCKDSALLNNCFDKWKAVKEHCEQNSITEGSVSPVELERFVQAVMVFGEDEFNSCLVNCVISKATSNSDDQRDIKSICGIS